METTGKIGTLHPKPQTFLGSLVTAATLESSPRTKQQNSCRRHPQGNNNHNKDNNTNNVKNDNNNSNTIHTSNHHEKTDSNNIRNTCNDKQEE